MISYLWLHSSRDQTSDLRLAGKVPRPESYSAFIGFAWKQMIATGASGWSTSTDSNDFGKQSPLLHEGSLNLQLLFGVFGLRLDSEWLPVQGHMNCEFGPVTDAVERSLRPSRFALFIFRTSWCQASDFIFHNLSFQDVIWHDIRLHDIMLMISYFIIASDLWCMIYEINATQLPLAICRLFAFGGGLIRFPQIRIVKRKAAGIVV